ncbi:MAG: rRNA maturation RNase YbeY [Lachnospiraceae bacterium]|nr:rRNA maturation RNase YbeY [Lachnospiraceae bacterium]
MTFYVDREAELFLENNGKFDLDSVTALVIKAVMASEKCGHETQINIVLTDDANIKQLNFEARGIDKPTDVLSFPALSFKTAANFAEVKDNITNFDLESGELLLGDIIISVEKVREQATAYGHSLKREYAFLLTHSLLHLLGHDHDTEDEASIMEEKQETILNEIGIFR